MTLGERQLLLLPGTEAPKEVSIGLLSQVEQFTVLGPSRRPGLPPGHLFAPRLCELSAHCMSLGKVWQERLL